MVQHLGLPGLKPDRRTAVCILLLLMCGALWGAVPMLSKIAGGIDAHPVGLSLLVNLVGVLVCGSLCLITGKLRWPNLAEVKFFLNWAVLYAVFNQVLIYWLSAKLDAAIVSAFTVLEGLMIFAAAGCFGLEKPSLLRCSGLFVGLGGAALLVVSPNLLSQQQSGSVTPLMMCVGLLIPLSYAAESLYMAARRPPDVDPLYGVFGVMFASVPMLLALVWATDDFITVQFPPGPVELAAVTIMTATLLANLLYFRLLAMAGAVFSGQVSYFNALFGIGWGVVVLGEHWTWSMMTAFLLMLFGLYLVRPQPAAKTPFDLETQNPWPAE